MSRQPASQPLPKYTGPKNVSRRQKLNSQARAAGYQSYSVWLKARRTENVPKTRQSSKPQKRAYKSTRGPHRTNHYYNFISFADLTKKAPSIWKAHKQDAYMITVQGRMTEENIKRFSDRMKRMREDQGEKDDEENEENEEEKPKKPKKATVYRAVTELTIIDSLADLKDLIELAKRISSDFNPIKSVQLIRSTARNQSSK